MSKLLIKKVLYISDSVICNLRPNYKILTKINVLQEIIQQRIYDKKLFLIFVFNILLLQKVFNQNNFFRKNVNKHFTNSDFLTVIQSINSKILKEVIHNKQFQITLSVQNDEEIIDFKNILYQSNDQIKCEIQPFQCYFIYENEKSGYITKIQYQQNTITIFRTNTNLNIVQKENKYRITTETYTDNNMPNSKTISSGLTLRWKFSIDGTIEFATICNKLTWLGIGFESNEKRRYDYNKCIRL